MHTITAEDKNRISRILAAANIPSPSKIEVIQDASLRQNELLMRISCDQETGDRARAELFKHNINQRESDDDATTQESKSYMKGGQCIIEIVLGDKPVIFIAPEGAEPRNVKAI